MAIFWPKDELDDAKADAFEQRSAERLSRLQAMITPPPTPAAPAPPQAPAVSPVTFDRGMLTPWVEAGTQAAGAAGRAVGQAVSTAMGMFDRDALAPWKPKPQTAIPGPDLGPGGTPIRTGAEMDPEVQAARAATAPPAGGEIDNSSRQAFVRSAWPHMLQAAEGDQNLAELMLAKAISENGSIGTGRPIWANNFSGIKGEGDAGSVEADTWEDYGQGRVNIRDQFAAYSTPQAGMAAFMGFLRENPRYGPALQQYQQTKDASELFRNIRAAGYATDPQWADKVENLRATQVAPITRALAAQAPARPASGQPVAMPEQASQAARSGAALQGITPPQFGLGDADAEAICGPVLAMAFMQANGRSMTIAEAKAAAQKYGGWTTAQGMGGPDAMANTLRNMGIPATYRPGELDIATIRRETQGGNPVGINTRGHYFVVEGVDEQGRLDLGNSAKALRASGGRQWFYAHEIASLGMGAPTGAIYKDAPSSPTPSVAVQETGMPPASPNAGASSGAPAASPPAPAAAAPTPQSAAGAPPVRDDWRQGAMADPLDEARAATGGGLMMKQGMEQPEDMPIEGGTPSPRPPVRDDWRTQDQGYTVPGSQPSGGRANEAGSAMPDEIAAPAPQRPANVPPTSRQRPVEEDAPPQYDVQISAGGPPTPSAQWTPVETAPKPKPKQVPVWDAQGEVIGYRQDEAPAAPSSIPGPDLGPGGFPIVDQPASYGPHASEMAAPPSRAPDVWGPERAVWERVLKPAVEALDAANEWRLNSPLGNLSLQAAGRELQGWEQISAEVGEDTARLRGLLDRRRAGDTTVDAEITALTEQINRKSGVGRDLRERLLEAGERNPNKGPETAGAIVEGVAATALAPSLGSGVVRNAAAAVVDPIGQGISAGVEGAVRGVQAAAPIVQQGAEAAGRGARALGEEAVRRLDPNVPRVPDDGPQMLGSGVVPSGGGESRRFYHGTGSGFDHPDPGKFDNDGLFGPGYYLTSDPRVAGGVGEGRFASVNPATGSTLNPDGTTYTTGDPSRLLRAGYAQQRAIANLSMDDAYEVVDELLTQAMRQRGYYSSGTLDSLMDLHADLSSGRMAKQPGVTPSYVIERARAILSADNPAADATVNEIAGKIAPGANIRPVDVPGDLRLLDIDVPLRTQPTLLDDIEAAMGDLEQVARFRNAMRDQATREIAGPMTVSRVYSGLEQALGNDKGAANRVLAAAGYDGITHAGGKRIPMRDKFGAPIEHDVNIIFGPSLPKIRNAMSGEPGGSGVVPRLGVGLRADAFNAAQGGVLGAVSEDMQAQSEGRESDPSERVRRALGAGALAVAGGRVARRGAAQAGRQRLGSGVVGNESLNAATRTHVVPPHVADELDFPVRNPTDPAVLRAIEAAGGTVDERGTTLNVIRYHGPEASGGTATRGMTFYTAGPKGTPSPYASHAGAQTGGNVRIEGETRFRSPLILSDAPGGSDGFEEAARQLGIKGADGGPLYNWDLDDGIRQARAAGPAGSPERAQALKDLVTRYGGTPEEIDDLLAVRGADDSESAWAIKENIVAANARRQQYDGVVTVQQTIMTPDQFAALPEVAAAKARMSAASKAADDAYGTFYDMENGPLPPGAKAKWQIPGYNEARDAVLSTRAELAEARKAYQELVDNTPTTKPKITELADVREARNPTPGNPTADMKSAYKRAKDAEARRKAVQSQPYPDDVAEQDALIQARREADREWQEASDALDALMNEADTPPGYALRSDIPRRAPVRESTIEENPALPEARQEYEAALSELRVLNQQKDAFYEQNPNATSLDFERAHPDWADREVALYQRFGAASDAMGQTSRYRTAPDAGSTAARGLNAGLPFDPTSAALGAGAGAPMGEDGEYDPLRSAAGMAFAGVARKGGRRVAGAAARRAAPVAPDAFIALRNRNPREAFMSPLTPDKLQGVKAMVLGTEETGFSGYALTPDGDIQNVFSVAGQGGAKTPGLGAHAMLDAIEQGGHTLDAYDGFLPDYYHQFGFEEVGRVPFNRAYAPANWDYDTYGEPDVVLMARRGFHPGDTPDAVVERILAKRESGTWHKPAPAERFADWDAAAAARQRFLDGSDGGGDRAAGVGSEGQRAGVRAPAPAADPGSSASGGGAGLAPTLGPVAQRVMDTYAELTPKRVERITARGKQVARGALARQTKPGAMRTPPAELVDQVYDAVVRNLEDTKVVMTGLNPGALRAFLRGEGLTSKVETKNLDVINAITQEQVNVAGGRLKIVDGKRKKVPYTLEDAAGFAQRESEQMRAFTAGTRFPDPQTGAIDTDAPKVLYAYVSEGQPLVAPNRPTLGLVWNPETPRVSSVNHPFGAISRAQDIHVGMAPGNKELVYDPDAVRGAEHAPAVMEGGRLVRAAPGAEHSGELAFNWEQGGIDIGGGRKIADSDLMVGPDGESQLRATALVTGMTKEIQRAIARGEMTDPEQIAAVLMRGGSPQWRPGWGSVTNPTRTESLVLDPNLANVQAIYISGTQQNIKAMLEGSRTGGPGGGKGERLTELEMARRMRAAILEQTGNDVPILFTDTTRQAASKEMLAAGASNEGWKPSLISDAEVLEGPPLTLSPGRGRIVDQYTQATDPTTGKPYMNIGSRLPFDPASAAAGGAAGAMSTEEGEEGDPLRAGAGMAVAGILGRRARRPASQAASAAADPTIRNMARMLSSPNVPTTPNPRGFMERWAQAMTDDRAGLRAFQEAVSAAIGRPLQAGEMVAELTRRNPASIAGQRLQEELRPALLRVGDDDDYLAQYLTHSHNVDVAREIGQQAYEAAIAAGKSPLKASQAAMRATNTRQFSGDLRLTETQAQLRAIEQHVRSLPDGDTRWQAIQDAAQGVWDMNKRTLERKRDAGIISDDLYTELTRRYPKYVRTDIADYFDKGTGAPGGGSKRVGLSDIGIQKISAAGTAKERINPLLSTVEQTYAAESAIVRNEAGKAFEELLRLDPTWQSTFKEVVPAQGASRGNPATTVPSSYTLRGKEKFLRVWDNGAERTFVVPGEYAALVSPQAGRVLGDNVAANGWRNMMGVYKSLITSKNPAFSFLVSPVRDAGDYVIREAALSAKHQGPLGVAEAVGALPRIMADYAAAIPDAFAGLLSNTYKGDLARMMREGAGQGSRPGHELKDLQQAYGDLRRTNGLEVRTTGDLLRIAGQALTLGAEPVGGRIEQIPRLAAARRAARRGADETGQAMAFRDATVDFQRAGEWSRAINELVPFFNVAMQGGAQTVRTVKANPAAALAATAATIGSASVAAEAWNRSDEQRARDYEDVPDYLKKTGIVVMLPGVEGRNERGDRLPNYLWAPVGQYGALVQTAKEAAIRTSEGKGGADLSTPAGWAELLNEVGGVFSPLRGESAGAVTTSLIPPGLSTAADLAADRDLYRGSKISTDQRDENASALSQVSAAGWNTLTGAESRPSQWEHAYRDMGGFAATAGLAASNMAAEAMGARRPKDEDRPIQSAPIVGGLVGRTIRDTGGQRMEEAREDRNRVPESIRPILEEAGIRREDVLAVSSRYKGAQLTREEQEQWQTATNDLIERYIDQAQRSPKYRIPSTREQAVRDAIAKAKEDAAKRARLPSEVEMQRRLRDEQQRKAG